MDKLVADLIQKCYLEHDGDGSFVRDDRAIPFKVARPPADGSGAILIVRRSDLIREALGYDLKSRSPGLLGRGALPSPEDDNWIRAFLNGHRLFFLGDLGPADLLYFAWFRLRFHHIQIKYLGISDCYLEEVGVADPSKITYRMEQSQQHAMIQVESVLPDWYEVVGPQCAETLRSGSSIDLAGIVGLHRTVSSLVPLSLFEP